MEQSYTMSFPASRSCLWDSSATGERMDVHLTSSHWLVVYVKKTAITLAVKHHCRKVYVNDTDDGLVLEIDRFDPGKVSAQDHQKLAPTATLPGDYIIPLTVVSSSTPNMEGMMTHNMADMGNSLKELLDHCRNVTVLEPARMASIRMMCSCDPDGPSHVAIKCGCVLVDHLISVTPIPTLPIVPTALARNLMGPHPLSVVQGRIRNGFLTMEQTRKPVLLLSSDPKVPSLPLVGVWLSGVSSPHHPAVWTACVQYVSSVSPLRDRVFSEDGCFLVLLFPPSPTQPVCLQAKVGQDGCYDFHSCGCRVTSDELETPNHIPLELIPTSPNSADHTLFMSALKSCTGDHTIPRTDHVMPAPAAHVLDENTSPDPQPTPTMAPRPPKRNDGSLCVSVLDNEGCGSLQQANWGGGAAPLADNTDRLLNTTNDNSSLCSDTSCCSTSVLSQHQPVGRADLIALQQKAAMLLQTHPLVNNNGSHMSGNATPSSCSNEESFASHMIPQPHPCLSGLICCSDSSGCGCHTNTLDMQSYEESITQDGSMKWEGMECAKEEGLMTCARLPHYSQLSSPFVGESASIVVASGDHNPANQTAVTQSSQLQMMVQQIQQLLAAQTDYSGGSCDPDITHRSDQSMMLALPEHLGDGLSVYGHTLHDDNDMTILPIPRIQCSNSYYHSNTSSSNITVDEHSQMAELIALKYLRKREFVTEKSNTLPPSVVTRDTEVSIATRQYLQRHGLDDTCTVENKYKPSSDGSSHSDNNMVLDIKRLRSLPKLY
ncbi:uncharacterized protein [Dysidea avara]|uniref:uncharacterized protein isoform X2 n=1 Tax=Dysidea avara TaxID=196820 RepID=UPI00332BFAB4